MPKLGPSIPDYALSQGKSSSTGYYWRKHGLPLHEDGSVDVSKADVWLRTRSADAIVPENGDEDPYDAGEPPPWNEVARRKEYELARNKWLQNEQLIGRLMPKEDVHRVWKKVIFDAKSRLEGLPEKLALLVTEQGLRQILEGQRNPRNLVEAFKEEAAETIRDVLATLAKGESHDSKR